MRIKPPLYWLFLLPLLFCPGSLGLLAQLPPDIRLFDASDGLSFRDVRHGARDKRGFLWIVNSGIDFYDGQTVTSYNRFDAKHRLPVSNIRSAGGLGDSLLLFSEVKDLYALNMNNGKVNAFPYPEGMDLTFNDLIYISDRQHHPDLLLFTRSPKGTTIHVVNRQWRHLFAYQVLNTERIFPKTMRSYANGPEGVLWLLDEDNKHILRIDANGKKEIPFSFPLRNAKDAYRFFTDGQSAVYICRNDGLIFILRDGSDTVEPFLKVPFPLESFFPIHVGSGNWIWAQANDQLIRFNTGTKKCEQFHLQPFGVYNPVFRGSYEDDEGIIWIFSEMGLLQIKPEPKPFLSLYTEPLQRRNAQFREIIPATPNSVYCRVYTEQASIVEITLRANEPPDTTVRVKKLPRSGLIHRIGEALYYIPSGADTMIRYALPDFQRTDIPLPVQANKQFFNTFLVDGQIIYYQDISNQLTGFNPYTRQATIIPLEFVPQKTNSPWRSLQKIGKSRILVGTETAGLLVFDQQTGKFIRAFNDTQPTPLSGNYINTILPESDSVVWLGTLGAGINRVNIETGSVKSYTTLDGLANNMVASMLMDDAGNLWIGTYGGLSMLKIRDQRFYNYYDRDGLSNDEFNYLSAYKSETGQMFMGTINGITLFHPDDITGTRSLPPVEIIRIERYHQHQGQLITEGRLLNLNQPFVISPYDNYVEFTFAVPSYRANDSHVFFYKMTGVDKEWQRLGRTNSIRYQKLLPGDHILEIMAADANGNITRSPTTIRLHVQQVYYRSTWFIGLVILLLTIIGYSVYRYRIRMLTKEHQTRTRIASDLHDEVGGSLTGLYLQLQVMELRAQGEEKSRLAKVNSIIHQSITKMRDLVWSIDARSDTWDKMLERMEDFASDTLSPRDIRYVFHQRIQPDKRIDAHLKHNLYLIFKEAIHNIAKHSNATEATFDFEEKDGRLIMEIKDNGKPQEKGTVSGQGLQNIKMRAERIKADLQAGFDERGYVVRIEL